jgi:uncharacterized BrkB/YihY/UPF0761 family membrane protein
MKRFFSILGWSIGAFFVSVFIVYIVCVAFYFALQASGGPPPDKLSSIWGWLAKGTPVAFTIYIFILGVFGRLPSTQKVD